jgi:hypothetical protein
MKVRSNRSAWKLFLFLFVVIFFNGRPSAQTVSPDSITMEKIRSIQLMLDKGKPAANTWWYGWLTGYSVATVVQTGIAVSSNKLSNRQDMVLGAGTTLLGAAGQLLTPMVPAYASSRLSAYPERTAEENTIKLKAAEDLLRLSALREKEGRSWKTHAICETVNLGSGLITWVGFKRNIWAGLGNFALNTAISEAQIWSQPTRAIKDYKHYCDKLKTGLSYKPEPRWQVNAYPGGIAFRLVF